MSAKLHSSMTNLVASVIMSLALVLASRVPSVRAASGSPAVASASSLGLYLSTMNRRLMVIGVTGTYANLGVRFGDQIVAVNGRRVSTEAAFLNRLTMARRGAQTVMLTVARDGRLLAVNVPALPRAEQTSSSRVARSGGSGFMNPALMVRTSQGVMHRDAAARLGLPGTPIEGSPPHDPGPGQAGFSRVGGAGGFGFMNPALMVRTSQGVMHRAAAARLGLPGTPIEGTPDHPEFP